MILNMLRRCAALLLALTAVAGGTGFSVLDAIAFHRGPATAFECAMDDAAAPLSHGASCTLAGQLPAWLPTPAVADAPRTLEAVVRVVRQPVALAVETATQATRHSRAPPRI